MARRVTAATGQVLLAHWRRRASPDEEISMITQERPPIDTSPVVPPRGETPPIMPSPGAMPPAATSPAPSSAERRPDGRIIAGIVLIVFGTLALLATFYNSSEVGLFILPTLGILFIVWGLVARVPGLLIPGGILTGLGLGTVISELAFASAAGDTRGGIIVLGLGVGFLMIMPLIMIISSARHWWSLIPGGILAITGIALLAGGPALSVLSLLGRLWPIAPIIVGVALIWQMLRKR
jgi:hypothetical protein